MALTKPRPGAAPGGRAREQADAETAVTELYHAHALGLTRLAHVMLGDHSGAEDIVHDAFYGLYRRWDKLADKGKAQQYLRSSVLNGCRTELRRGHRHARQRDSPRAELRGRAEQPAGPAEQSAEAAVLADEGRHAVLAAIMRLPHRQREVLVLRYYLDEPEAAIAGALGIAGSTVRSTLHRALARLSADLLGGELRERP